MNRLSDSDDPSEGASHLLFAYGTLQLQSVQMATFGRKLSGRGDSLRGFELVPLLIEDATVVAVSGKDRHSMARPARHTRHTIAGTVFEVTSAELRQADAYEVAAVRRIAVTLESGLRAWTYVDAGSPTYAT